MHILRRLLIIVLTALLNGATVGAAEPGDLTEWDRGPVRFLMTDAEVRQWRTIPSGDKAVAEAFVQLFWARRDPTPGTPENEFPMQFEARVKYADEHFSEGNVRGALTDRGKVLILLGPPTRATVRNTVTASPTVDAEPEGESPAGAPGELSPESARTQMWTYEESAIPAFAGDRPFEVSFASRRGSREFRLAPSRIDLGALFEKAVKAFLVSPDLTEPPSYAQATPAPVEPEVPITLPTESIRSAYEAYREGGRTGDTRVFFTSGSFVTSDGDDFVAVQLFVPESAASLLDDGATFFGQVESPSGEPELAWEESADRAGTFGGDRWLDRSLTLSPGEHVVTLGIAKDGSVLAMTGGKVEAKDDDADAAGTSDLILSNQIYALEQAQRPTDPFAFGGLKVVPRGDGVFTTNDELWYFVELRHPGVGEDGAHAVQAKLDVEGKTSENKTVKMAAPMAPVSLTELRGVPGHYGVGTSIPLASFKPGDYVLKVKVFDSIRKETWNFEKPFRVVE